MTITNCHLKSKDIEELDNPIFCDLKHLDLSYNDISELTYLMKLTELETLNLSFN